MLLVVMLIGMAAALLVYGMVDTSTIALRRNQDTAAAFAQAKQALIGRAASDANRPGSLPCPDTDDDGSAESPIPTDCPSYIGRLPWRTLGLPDLRDGSGERLWYAVLSEFARNPTCAPNCPINSDTKGNITVYQDSAATTITTEAVAVIFAPGAALGTQNRDTVATALCPTTGTTIACNLCAANYLDLETAAGVNNATTSGPFISAPNSGTFNDKVMVIATADLMPVVEQRVARELLKVLQLYKANSGCNCYPWPDLSTGISDFGLNRGRIPGYDALNPSGPYALPVNWGVGGAPTLPQWFTDNGWRRIIYYAVGKNFLENGGVGCTSCEPSRTYLSVSVSVDPLCTLSVWDKEVVILTPGPAGAGRPVTPYPWTDWTPYLDDAGNNDNSNDCYVTPSSTAYARDRIYTFP